MHILYIGFSQPHNSIDGVYIKGLRENNIEVKAFFFPTASLKRYSKIYKTYWQYQHWADISMVGYASPQAVILLGLLTRKKIIYNALCSEFERKIVSRQLARPSSIKGLYYWLLDYAACRLATIVMLESQHQIDYCIRLFRLPARTFLLARTGVDDGKFFIDPGVKKFDRFTVLFRGRLLPEAGAEYLVRAAKELEGKPIDIVMLAAGQELLKIEALVAKLKLTNFKLITNFLSESELREIMLGSHLSLGQLGDHNRLQRTIPHKAYESMAMQLPYLTARNPGVMELFKENETCLAFTPADSHDLAQKIFWAYEHADTLSAIAQRAYALYQKQLTPRALARVLLEHLRTLKIIA